MPSSIMGYLRTVSTRRGWKAAHLHDDVANGRSWRREVSFLGFVLVGLLLSVGVAQAATTGLTTAEPAINSPGPAADQANPPDRGFFNRPTLPMSEYKAAKANRSASIRPGGPSAPSAPTGTTNLLGFNGITQATAQSTWPPDINGSVSATQVVQTVNQHLTVFNKAGTQTSDRSFATLTGSSGLFDPRVIYDPVWKRWVAQIERAPDSSTLQHQFLLISTSDNANGSYRVYDINISQLSGTGTFWDYPQIGLQQDAVVLTGSSFTGNTFNGARAIAIAKSVLYNGRGFSVPNQAIPASDGTLTPTNVIDQNPAMHMLTRSVHNVTFTNPANGFYGRITSNVAIGGFYAPSVPRDAGQAGCTTTSCLLDTSDARFASPGTQYGDNVWNVAAYGLSGNGSFATPSWGQFDIEGAGANTTKQRGQTFQSGCSDDFNPSLVAGTNNTMWINYNSTNPNSCSGGTFVKQVVGGRVAATAAGSVSTTVPFTSPAQLTGNFDSNFGTQRWGDTSSVSTDPSDATVAYTWNESVANSSTWGTRAQKVRVVP